MKRFKIIEHTADIGLIAYGKTLGEAFANAAYGMFSTIADLRAVREMVSHVVEVSKEDSEALLFEWLNRFLYFFNVETLIFKRFDVIEFDDNRIKANCYGEKYDPKRHQIKTGIKSATYYMLKVNKEKNQVQVIFDI